MVDPPHHQWLHNSTGPYRLREFLQCLLAKIGSRLVAARVDQVNIDLKEPVTRQLLSVPGLVLPLPPLTSPPLDAPAAAAAPIPAP